MTVHRIGRRTIEDLMIASSDGELGATDRLALAAHVATCTDCAALARQHDRLAQRLASPIRSEAAERASLEWLRTQRPRSASFTTRLLRFTFATTTTLAAAVLAIAAVFGINEVVGRLEIPQREVVVERTQSIAGDTVILRVEDGRFAAVGNQTSGVVASADLRLATPRTGSAELRFAQQGEAYGVLGGAPDLTGVTRLHIENRIPDIDSATTFEIWLHIEAPEPTDSQHISVRVEPTHGGIRARAP
jgi:hypothetical protein